MNNAEIFSQTFGIYATEMWAMSESEFLSWLNSLHDVNATNTTDSISKDKAIEAIDEVRDLISVTAYCAITERLKEVPSAERKGEWIELYENNYQCSECNAWWTCEDTPIASGMNFCPNCGARMEGEEE